MTQRDDNSIENKLTSIKYNCSKNTHLRVNQEMCRNCQKRPYCYICPAKVYSWADTQSKLNVEYENCLECGACKVVCPFKSIDWEYPNASCGVILKNS